MILFGAAGVASASCLMCCVPISWLPTEISTVPSKGVHKFDPEALLPSRRHPSAQWPFSEPSEIPPKAGKTYSVRRPEREEGPRWSGLIRSFVQPDVGEVTKG